jgi:hypothetical protein
MCEAWNLVLLPALESAGGIFWFCYQCMVMPNDNVDGNKVKAKFNPITGHERPEV